MCASHDRSELVRFIGAEAALASGDSKTVQLNPFALRDDRAEAPGPERARAFERAVESWQSRHRDA